MQTSIRTIAFVLVGSAALSACAPKPPKQLPPDPSPSVATATQTNADTMRGPAAGSQADFAATLIGRDTIYFDTDKFNVDSDDAAALQVQAQWLLKYPSKRASIEGHCDERGTRDYNIALGEKRANAAKNYLVSLGVDAARLTTISYGKERPAAMGSDEQAWAKNRRAVTVTVD
ncbi:MAG: peptidoglycan-associated lipoprotein Pal [Novosphingobium sp.]